MLKKVLIKIKIPKKKMKRPKLKTMFALKSLNMSVEEFVVVTGEAQSILMIRLGLISQGKIEGTHQEKEPSEMSRLSRAKRSKLIKRKKESRRIRPALTDQGEKDEDVDMLKAIESIITMIDLSAEEAEASEVTIDRNGVKMRNLVKIATKRMPIRLRQGLTSKPSLSKEIKSRKTHIRIGDTMTAREAITIAKTANLKIASHSVTNNPTGRMTMMAGR